MDLDVSTLAAARAGDERAFEELVASHRRELRAHCYRMLGSLDDADDALQETLVAAWRGLAGFEGRSSLRSWLYRIATNCCLRLGRGRPPLMLSWDHAPARDPLGDLGSPLSERIFLDPWPDSPGSGDGTDPALAYAAREGVELAFVAALQHLPPNQRAVLILRDVLAFAAAEVAQMLETSAASVTSALQRARESVAARVQGPHGEASGQRVERLTPEQREVVDAFVAAWERSDVDAVVALLAQDVRFTMPPLPAWFDGREDVGRFLAERVFATPWRLRPVTVNGQVGFACYQGVEGGFRPGSLTVLSFREGRISWLASFVDPGLFARSGLPSRP